MRQFGYPQQVLTMQGVGSIELNTIAECRSMVLEAWGNLRGLDNLHLDQVNKLEPRVTLEYNDWIKLTMEQEREWLPLVSVSLEEQNEKLRKELEDHQLQIIVADQALEDARSQLKREARKSEKLEKALGAFDKIQDEIRNLSIGSSRESQHTRLARYEEFLDALQGQGSSGKKPQFKKKEGETAFVWDQDPTPRPRFQHKPTYSPYPYYPNPYPVYNTNISHPRPRPNYANPPTAPFQIPQPNFQQTRPRPPYPQRFPLPNRPTYNYPQPTETYNQNRARTFTNLGRPLDQLYEQLKAAGKIGVIPPPTYPYGVPAGYNPQFTCAYHSGAPRHSTANCRLLKHKVQDMVEAGEIVIRKREEQGPNVSKNRLPEHTGTIGVIMDDEEFKELVRSMSNEIEVCGIMEQPFVIEEASYEEDKRPFILDLTPSESAALEPVIIEFPEQVPVLSLRQVPWNYSEPVLQIGGKPVLKEEVSVVTRSGKIASPSTANAPIQVNNREPTTKPAVTEREAWDFLKRLRRSEYNVVEQLNKMPAQISILDLLFTSDLHRDALLEVLTKARIPKDISLPAEGTGHNKALYVAVRCNGKMLPKVLIDNGSALNICPWSTLVKLGLQDVKLKPSETVVRGFDGAQRESIGEVNLVFEMGPAQFQIACQVMHFPSVYNVLLGRPWIHSSGAVPSSLHQVLKFVVNNQLITIFAEEDCIVIADSKPEEDGNQNASVSSYRTADIVSVCWITSKDSKDKMVLPAASVMMAKEMIRGGYEFDKGLGRNLQGMLKPVELIEKKDLFGLGFRPTARDIQEMKARKRAEKEGKIGALDIPPLRYTFPKPAEVITSEFSPIDEVETSLTHLFVGAISENGPSDDAEFPDIPQ
ncbi:uncharacterized protein LOC113774253 [Coffea eugenioides]|uniref:uncharacterized protein LOC113774253 n=1 Tax=Coffea eugenioides TaxID=49369 RepID=UPI000F610C3F|nr:uncharacterized protein LOC113774253 [Coffea eugenioides]